MPPKTPKSAPSTESDSALSFEKGLEQLERIVRELERGELALEDSIALFEQGVQLTDVCRKQLEDAEMRVEMLRPGAKQQPGTAPAAAANADAQNADIQDEDLSGDGDDDGEDLPF
ncbi:MAG: exodeoxyribonuclease VII small subunit [Bryobacterales bacterium]|nr:exodeoxyribonuclease VII small subunit [Bryobacterales bacterium]